MDRSAEWPWNLEEEVEWKAQLEQKDYDLVNELIDSAADADISPSRPALNPEDNAQEVENDATDKYLITT